MLSLANPPGDTGVLRGAPETPGCASHAKKWVLTATILGSSTAFLQASVVNVALPAIQDGLHASAAEMQWIASIYTLFLAALILAAGSAGDRFGRRRLFVAGLTILAVASAAGGAAADGVQLVIARAVQGIGGALLVPNSLALLSAAFPKAERGRAIGIWSSCTALTGTAGPILGGWLVDTMSWRAIFLLGVPVAAVTAAIAVRRVPDVRVGRRAQDVDWAGAALGTVGLGCLVFGIVSAAGRSADVLMVVLPIGISLLLLAALVWVEARSPAPMVPGRLFRSTTFVGANLLTLLLYFALTGAFFVLPFVLVRVHGYSATATGAAYLPFAMLIAALSRWSGGLSDRVGARIPLVAGPVIVACSFLLFGLPGTAGSYWATFFTPMALLGVGMAITVAPLTSTVMTAVDDTDVGVASGVNNTAARVAGLLAIAIVGLLALRVFGEQLATNLGSLELSPAVRGIVADRQWTLGMVMLPAGTTGDERHLVDRAASDALVASFRWVVVLCALLAAGAAVIAATTIDAHAASAPGAADSSIECVHLELVVEVPPRTTGCEECLALGERWVQLRACLTCGHVGCCDSSKRRHATAHFWATKHPIVRSLEPGEDWRWCYLDDVAV